LTGEKFSFINQSPLAILPRNSSRNKAGGTGEGNYEFGLLKYHCSYFERFFNML
jgi:hypothetical protein